MRHVEAFQKEEDDGVMGTVIILYIFCTDIPPDEHMQYGFAFSDAPAFYRRTPYSSWKRWNRNYAT